MKKVLVYFMLSISLLFATCQIQYDSEADRVLHLNGNTLRGNFSSLRDCESYRSSRPYFESSHSRCVGCSNNNQGYTQPPSYPSQYDPIIVEDVNVQKGRYFNNMANDFFSKRNYKKAIYYYKKALQYTPYDKVIKQNLNKAQNALANESKETKTRQDYNRGTPNRTITQEKRKNAEYYHGKGDQASVNADYVQAIKFYENALRNSPDDRWVVELKLKKTKELLAKRTKEIITEFRKGYFWSTEARNELDLNFLEADLPAAREYTDLFTYDLIAQDIENKNTSQAYGPNAYMSELKVRDAAKKTYTKIITAKNTLNKKGKSALQSGKANVAIYYFNKSHDLIPDDKEVSILLAKAKTKLPPLTKSKFYANGKPIGIPSNEHAKLRRIIEQGKYARMNIQELDQIASEYKNKDIIKIVGTLKIRRKAMANIESEIRRFNSAIEVRDFSEKESKKAAKEALGKVATLLNVPFGGSIDAILNSEMKTGEVIMMTGGNAITDKMIKFAEAMFPDVRVRDMAPSDIRAYVEKGKDLYKFYKAADRAAERYVDAMEAKAFIKASKGTNLMDKWSHFRNKALEDSAKLYNLIEAENRKSK